MRITLTVAVSSKIACTFLDLLCIRWGATIVWCAQDLFRFAFDFSRAPNQRSLDMETAIALLDLLLGNRWADCATFLTYLRVCELVRTKQSRIRTSK